MYYTELSFPENSLFLVTGSNLCAATLELGHWVHCLDALSASKLYTGAHKKVLVDVKSMLDEKAFDEAGYVYWRL